MSEYEEIFGEYDDIYPEEPEQSSGEHQAFTVDNDVKAEWVIRKMADNDKELNDEISRLEEQMNWYKKEIEKAKAEHDRSNDYFSGLLQNYFDGQPHKVTKTGIEKYKLPSAELVLKPQEPEFTIEDNDAMVNWLTANEHMNRYLKPQMPKVDWKELKKGCKVVESSVEDPITGEIISGYAVAFGDTGELVQGVSVVPRASKFVVDIKGGAL